MNIIDQIKDFFTSRTYTGWGEQLKSLLEGKGLLERIIFMPSLIWSSLLGFFIGFGLSQNIAIIMTSMLLVFIGWVVMFLILYFMAWSFKLLDQALVVLISKSFYILIVASLIVLFVFIIPNLVMK